LNDVSDVGGYVLAGGKSSRMGRDKALLELGGRPLIWYAVAKLRRVCADVHVLSSIPELEAFAPLVHDRHQGCGPMGGLEAALEHSTHTWSLLMPVDMPFLPSALLGDWVRDVLAREKTGARVAMFTVGGVPQPLFCLLHTEVTPYVRQAMEKGEFKVFPFLHAAGLGLAEKMGVDPKDVFLNLPWDDEFGFGFVASGDADGESNWPRTGIDHPARHLWFANLNTPAEFADAERNTESLETAEGDGLG
jgi:molybdopterin-guanine dinucleotide biosynthesis protein A